MIHWMGQSQNKSKRRTIAQEKEFLKTAFTKTETNYYAVLSVTNEFDDEPVRKA